MLEVIVSIAIITGGLIFVTRAYSTAKYAIQRSFVLFRSGLLLESSMFEFEEKGEVESDFKYGKEFPEDRDYTWLISTTEVPVDPALGQKLDLNLVTLQVSRSKDVEEKKGYVTNYYLTTYLDKKSE